MILLFQELSPYVSQSFLEISPDTYKRAECQRNDQKLEHIEYFRVEVENNN